MNSLKNNILYESFLSKRSLPSTNKVRLNNILNIQEEEWKNIYCLPQTVNVDHKTKELQYKILNNYLNTNARLKRIKILDDDLCSFCSEEAETSVEHLSCVHVRKFWNEFLGWYLQFSQAEINIDYRTVVLGWRTADPPLLENFILLTAKSFIFRSKINSNPASLTHFKKVLISCYLRERYSEARRQLFRRGVHFKLERTSCQHPFLQRNETSFCIRKIRNIIVSVTDWK